MAFNPAPSAWIPNWAEDGNDITVPIASFPELTAVEADGATGDIRKVLYALLAQLAAKWKETAEADRPAKLVLLETGHFDEATGQITKTYSFTLVLDVGASEVADEA